MESGPFEVDNIYDRWTMLFGFMASYRNAAMIRRLTRTPYFQDKIDSSTRLHLAPFVYPAEALAVLEHLRAAGISTSVMQMIEVELRNEVVGAQGRGHG
jgi:hypothetical protein